MTKQQLKGYPFLYAREFHANTEMIFELIRDGEIEVTVDYNRTGTNDVLGIQHLLIYRIKVLQ